MDNKKDDRHYIEKAIFEADLLIKSTKNIDTVEELTSDEMFLRGVVFTIGLLAETIKKVSQEFKDEHPFVPWRKVVDYRNSLFHEYGKTDFTVLFEIVKNQMIQLKDILEEACMDL